MKNPSSQKGFLF